METGGQSSGSSEYGEGLLNLWSLLPSVNTLKNGFRDCRRRKKRLDENTHDSIILPIEDGRPLNAKMLDDVQR